jgi:hypothetical protein
MNKCERCGATVPLDPDSFELMDYCAVCSKNLCPACMAKGCCGNVPAKSGNLADYGDEDE